MWSLRKKQRAQVIIFGLTLLMAAALLVGFGLKDGIEFYRSPSQLQNIKLSEDEQFRLGGMVEKNSVKRSMGETIRFTITDFENSVAVVYKGILPDLFSENQGVIATGILKGEVFYANEILAKHDESYMPKEVSDSLKEKLGNGNID